MFVELMPLLAGRPVLITVATVGDKTLRVNVIPHAKAAMREMEPDLAPDFPRRYSATRSLSSLLARDDRFAGADPST